jgi:hypothetical protein
MATALGLTGILSSTAPVLPGPPAKTVCARPPYRQIKNKKNGFNDLNPSDFFKKKKAPLK